MKTPTLPDHEHSARQRRAVNDTPTTGSTAPFGKRRLKPVAPPQTPKPRRAANGQFARKVKAK